MSIKIAVATSGGKLIDEHFGHAKEFTVYEVEADGTVLGISKIPGMGSCVCKDDGDSEVQSVFGALIGCNYVLVKRIGPQMVRELAGRGITAFELLGEIQPAIGKIIEYEKKQISGKGLHSENKP